MDPVLVEALVAMALRQAATWQDMAAKGTLTDADIDAMLTALGSKLAAFQAAIDAHKAGKPAGTQLL